MHLLSPVCFTARLLALNPRARITPAEALDHPYFTGKSIQAFIAAHPRLDTTLATPAPVSAPLPIPPEPPRGRSCIPRTHHTTKDMSGSMGSIVSPQFVPPMPRTRARSRSAGLPATPLPPHPPAPARSKRERSAKPQGSAAEASRRPLTRSQAAKAAKTTISSYAAGLASRAVTTGRTTLTSPQSTTATGRFRPVATRVHFTSSSDDEYDDSDAYWNATDSDSEPDSVDSEDTPVDNPVPVAFPGHDKPFSGTGQHVFPLEDPSVQCCVRREIDTFSQRTAPFYKPEQSPVRPQPGHCRPGHLKMTSEQRQAFSWQLARALNWGRDALAPAIVDWDIAAPAEPAEP